MKRTVIETVIPIWPNASGSGFSVSVFGEETIHDFFFNAYLSLKMNNALYAFIVTQPNGCASSVYNFI